MATKKNLEIGALIDISAMQTIRPNKLKKVKMLPKNMLKYDFEYFAFTLLIKPSSVLDWTWLRFNPSIGEGLNLSILVIFIWLFFFILLPLYDDIY